jgi:hypothetical protein
VNLRAPKGLPPEQEIHHLCWLDGGDRGRSWGAPQALDKSKEPVQILSDQAGIVGIMHERLQLAPAQLQVLEYRGLELNTGATRRAIIEKMSVLTEDVKRNERLNSGR